MNSKEFHGLCSGIISGSIPLLLYVISDNFLWVFLMPVLVVLCYWHFKITILNKEDKQ